MALTATAVGSEFLVANSSVDFAGSDDSVAELVFGANNETITISHSYEIVGSRAAGDDREIFIRRFDANDNLIGEPVRVNQITRGDQADPVIAAAADGTTLAVWSGRGEGDRQGIFARRFNADGTAAGDQFRVNTTRGGIQSHPDVAMSDDGTAVVTWHGVGDADASGVFLQRIGADDQLLGEETLVNSSTDGVQGYATVGMDSTGASVVAWSSRHQDGDDWGIFAQRFSADGTANGDEFGVNTTTDGSQHQADIDVTADGRFTVAWSSFEQDGASWGVFAQRFNADGTTSGTEFQVNSESAGHQMDPAIAVSDSGDLLVAWSDGVDDGSGWEVNARTFDADGAAEGEVVSVNQDNSGLASGHQRHPSITLDEAGNSIVLFRGVSASQGDGILHQRFDVDIEPAENLAPMVDPVDNQTIGVGETLEITIAARDPNSRDSLTYEIEPSETTPTDATITRIDNNSATLRWTPSTEDRDTRFSFRIIVTDDGDPSARDAAQFVVDVVNSAPALDLNGGEAGIDRNVDFPDTGTTAMLLDSGLTLTDNDNSELSSATVSLRSFPDANLESLAVDTTGTNITASYDASFGRLSLTGTDTLANYERVLESLEYTNTATPISDSVRFVEISVNDGSDSSPEATIILQIGENEAPTISAFPPITVIAGSPLHIPLNGMDADGDDLTYTVTSNNESLVTASVLEGNRSWRVSVEGSGANSDIQGDLVFELFEGRAPRATDRFIELTNDGFYEDIIFHRVVNNFVIQAGDPTGTGSGGSTLGDFDDQFHVDLQHNRTGLLSMAKSTDDTNDSQFFVTEGPTRHLDFNHTIFGLLVEGEDIREAISNVDVVAPRVNDRPIDPITITQAEVFVDNQNGVLVLSAPEGMTGDGINVAVTVSDGNGGTDTTVMSVEVIADTENGQPFLRDIPTINAAVDTPTPFQLTAEDVEGDDIFFFDEERLRSVGQPVFAEAPDDLDFTVDPNTGLLTITPQNGLTGTHQITVAVASSLTPGSNIDFQVIDVVISDNV